MKRVWPWLIAAGCLLGLILFIALTPAPRSEDHIAPADPGEGSPRNETEAIGAAWLKPPGTETAYAGDRACAACHPKESAWQARTPHARTVNRIGPGELRPEFLGATAVVDSSKGVTYRVGIQSGKCWYSARVGKKETRLNPDWVLGSGGQAHTYLKDEGSGFLEARITYYSGTKKWDYTPGRGPDTPPSPLSGNVYSPLEAASCFGCHSTVLVGTASRLDLDHSHLTVGCEACHEASRRHADEELARRSGPADAAPPSTSVSLPPKPAGEAQLQLCGACHRKPGEMDGMPIPAPDLARLTGVALGRSRCFRESGGRLVCTTCHNPHQAVSRSTKAYDSACTGCHTGTGAKTCTMRKTAECVTCHMPERAIASKVPLRFHSHRIQLPRGDVSVTSLH